ncbi:efflux RND transporter permease subunit [Bacteriovorax sp. PP10]|uniref:Efflux RND transporter permease subunit n=1 Tax=Bacteriovorax antarcticus TaxID=3088717 RepID=A0ABU5VRH6_9BACT|nr:efflux RND transporter permease subunit [Bacteriovorax sp. PP10]MEA9355512.1 efflux RND transporter permease subunit [Bacteriovorax sp. PP10]
MSNLYSKPLRVYIILGALAIWGIISGLQLPISLFPNSSQITISVSIPMGSLSSQQFFEAYGNDLESNLQGMKIESVAVKELHAEYRNQNANYQITFEWGADPEKAKSDVQNLVNSRMASASEDIRRGISVYSWSENRGFFAISFYSPMRSLDDLYQTLEPMITPLKSKIEDAGDFGLFNPNSKEVSISLIPEKLAQYEITTVQIQQAIENSVVGLTGGTLKLGEKDYLINLPKNTPTFEQLSQVRVSAAGKPAIFLKDIAKITMGVSKNNRQKFKTSGVESLILFASPKEGGNIKQMSDQIMTQMEILKKQWPADVEFKILVNPAEFINSSVMSVVHEVFLAAFLAVIVLFVFLGSFKNVITAAIEIPLSLLMAFILMRLAGMNLNLISLGGLALSAGMNVDASVVVLENIVRHFEHKVGKLTYQEKLQTVITAVNEVRLPIIASTLASLVVFFPLIFTQGLTHSLLGDLAKAVIFSHGLSAVVALVLVPTIRLQLLSMGQNLESKSPVEGTILKIENFYRKTLEAFLNSKKLQSGVFGGVILLLPILFFLVIPRLNKEVIGKPDSDWLIIGVSSPSFSTMKQLESELDDLEASIDKNFGDEKLYTFTQIQGSHDGNIMVRMKDKSKILKMVEKAEELYKNTSTKFYWAESWNPSELSIPDPPQYRLEITGGDPIKRLEAAQDIQALLLENGIFDKVRVTPTADKEKEIRVQQFVESGAASEVLSKYELSHYLRVATDGVYAEKIFLKQQEMPIYLRLNNDDVTSVDQLKALPIGFEGRLIPLGALANITLEDRAPRIYREDQKSLIVLTGRLNKAQLDQAKERVKKANEVLVKYKAGRNANNPDLPSLVEVQPDKELQASLDQLKWAVAISIALVFLTMVIQLGDFVHSLLVLVAIPLGFIGVLVSLFVFSSTLSLNSGLGTILLNGIAVANSIILVDFIRKLHEEGKDAKTATVEASLARLRPILMTSMTTVLGMLPIALGFGEGGKILQPLGIAVCGGLWVSMLLTLYIVPALQYLYLHSKEKKA